MYLCCLCFVCFFFFSSRRRHTRCALVLEFRRVLFRSLMAAMQALQEAAVTGIPPAPGVAELLQDAQDGVSRRLMLQKVADTLEILFKHYLSEQTPTFKKQMKHLVRRAKTCGIGRSEEHTSELQSLMRISYAVFCLKTKNRR